MTIANLSSTSLSLDPNTRAAMLLVEMSRRDRETCDALEESEAAARQSDQARELEARESAASAKFAGSLASSGLQIASGVTTAAGEFIHDDTVTKLARAAPAVDGAGKVCAALGDHTAAMDELSASHAGARATEHERTETRARHRAEASEERGRKGIDMARELAATQTRIDVLVVRG